MNAYIIDMLKKEINTLDHPDVLRAFQAKKSCIAREPATELLEDILSVFRGAESEAKIPVEVFSMAPIKLLAVQQPPIFLSTYRDPAGRLIYLFSESELRDN